MLDELRHDVQATLTSSASWPTASTRRCCETEASPRRCAPPPNRAALPTVVDADELGRYAADVEAAVYFCCLEALQNAGKHAGAGASIRSAPEPTRASCGSRSPTTARASTRAWPVRARLRQHARPARRHTAAS